MDQVQNERTTAQELVSFARQRGLDLEPLRNDYMIQVGQRWVYFWRRRDELPCSGPAEEEEGTIHYNLQGPITALPSSVRGSSGNFAGMWSEAGTFENIEQALELLRAWLIDSKEVDELPKRQVRRLGI